MSRVVSLSRFGVVLLRARAFRVVLGMLLALWGFDRGVWLFTQHSFFASVGLETWFWRTHLAPFGLFAAFFTLCTVWMWSNFRGLRSLEGEEAPPLRGILTRFEPLRARIGRISRALGLVLALLLAGDFARHGQEWVFLQGGGRSGFSYLGLDASLWTQVLPLWMPFLLGVWKFSLALGFLTAVTATLRALPVVAQRNNAPPALARILWRIGATLLGIRALLYACQILDLPRGAPLSSGDVWILAPLYLLGALWCGALCVVFLRRALKPVPLPRGKTSRAAALALAALFSPALLGLLSWPLRAIFPESAALKWERERATRAAWQLPDQSAVATGAATPTNEREATSAAKATNRLAAVSTSTAADIARAWPIWDAAAVLATRAGAGFRGDHLTGWKSATIEARNGEWSALVAGESVSASVWSESREVSKANALAFERLELPIASLPSIPGAASPARQKLVPIADAFYGFAGRSLFGPRGGVDLGSPALKWAWAWRERDLLLPLDAAREPHLLTLRGARERALALAPWLSVLGAPRLGFDGQNPVWTLDLCALSPHFPGAMRGQSSEFAGFNSASAPLQMQLDARSGAVQFFAAPEKFAAPKANWRAVYGGIKARIPTVQSDAGAELGRTQMEISNALRDREAVIYASSRGLNSRGQTSWQVLSLAKKDFELLEGAAPRPILQRGEGDLSARLTAIDAAIASASNSVSASTREAKTNGLATAQTAANPTAGGKSGAFQNGASENGVTFPLPDNLRAGVPWVRRDARAPGGFWLGRAFFAPPPSVEVGAIPSQNDAAHPPILWRVALTGSGADARVGVGTSVREALRDFSGEAAVIAAPRKATAPPLNSKALTEPGASTVVASDLGTPLEVQALQTERKLQVAAQSGDWTTYGALAKRQTALLERLVARRQSAESRNPKGEGATLKNRAR